MDKEDSMVRDFKGSDFLFVNNAFNSSFIEETKSKEIKHILYKFGLPKANIFLWIV